MALIKKFQKPPGPILNNFDELLNLEFSKYNISEKDEPLVRQALADIRDYTKDHPDSFSLDEVAEKYNITGTGDFVGSEDAIKTNWFSGNLKIKNKEDANSLAALIYHNATKEKKKLSEVPKVESSDVKILNFNKFIVDKFGGEQTFSNFWNGLESSDKAKGYLKENAGELLDLYLKNEDDDSKKYIDREKASALKAIIADPNSNWDLINENAVKLGWDFNQYLSNVKSNEDAIKLKNEEAAKASQLQIEADKTAKLKADFIKLGMPEETATQFVASGFTEIVGDKKVFNRGKDVSSAFNSQLKDRNLKIFRNPTTGDEIIVDQNYTRVDESGSYFNEFSPLFGLGWNHNQNKLTINQVQGKKQDFGNIGIGLNADIKGYEGWEVMGWPGSNSTPGNRDYTHTLILTKGKDKITLVKDVDGKYKNLKGELFTSPVFIKSYDRSRQMQQVDYTKAFSSIESEELPPAYNYQNDLNFLKKSLEAGESGELGSQARKAAGRLLSSLSDDPKVRQNTELKKIITDVLGAYQDEYIKFHKKGGVLKLQSGSYIQRYMALNKDGESQVKKSDKPARDITGTWKDMGGTEKALRATSLIGTGASFIPGVGVIGAGTTLVTDILADIAKDGLQKEDFFNWNTAANVGFVFLSAIGLGGVKALLKAGKAAKGISTAEGVAKAAKNAKSLGVTAEELKSLKDLDKLATKLKAKSLDDLVVKVGKMEKVTPNPTTATKFNKNLKDYKEILTKGEQTLREVMGTKIPPLNSRLLGAAVDKGKKAFEGVQNSKGLLRTAQVGLMTPGVVSAGQIYSDIKNGGLEYTKPSDFKNLLMAGSIGNNMYRDIVGIKALKSQNIGSVGKNETTFKIGNETVSVGKVLEKPKLSKNLLNRDKINVSNQSKLDEYKESVIKAAEKEGKVLTKDDLKDLTLDDFAVSAKSRSKDITLGESRSSTGKGRWKDEKDYNRAKQLKEKYGPKDADAGEKKVKTPASPEKKAKIKEFRTNYSSTRQNLKQLEEGVKHTKNPNWLKKIQRIKKDLDDLYKAEWPKIAEMKRSGGVLKLSKGSPGNTDLNRSPFNLSSLSNLSIDRTDLDNSIMFANHFLNNTKSGIEQRRAVSEGMFSMPVLNKPFMRITNDYLLGGYREAAKMNTTANKLANATSDIDKSNAIRLNAAIKNTETANQYARENASINASNLRDAFTRNLGIDQQNISIVANNKANAAEARKNIHLINANEGTVKTTAFDNLLIANNRNRKVKDYENSYSSYLKMLDDKDYKDLLKQYSDLSGTVGEEAAKKLYSENYKKATASGQEYATDFTTSQEYKDWQKNLKDLSETIRLRQEPISKLAREIQMNRERLYFKKGGSLSVADRIAIDNNKFANTVSLKSLERVFKQILHNNEMLHKALIKVFKEWK